LAYSPHHREAIDRAPLEHILIETDAPVEYEGKVTEPADVLLTLHELSRLKNMDALEVAAVTTANAIKFFKLPQSCGRHINSVGKSNRYPD
ncbi:MAG: TatD family hydrolase, partial [Desulfoferrobacter sp.]